MNPNPHSGTGRRPHPVRGTSRSLACEAHHAPCVLSGLLCVPGIAVSARRRDDDVSGRPPDELPEDLARQVFTHASWSERRGDSYARLAFLGDSVLALAVTAHLYPRLEAERFGAGRLTKIRAQAVSGVSCRAVAERLALPERLRAAAPEGVRESAAALVETERVLASVIEAVIGACYLHAGYERTAEAVVRGVRAGDRGRPGATRSTSSRRCRSCWRGAARRSPTR